MMAMLRDALTYLGGGLDTEPRILRGMPGFLVRCLVWALAIVVIYICSGQSGNFIYINF